MQTEGGDFIGEVGMRQEAAILKIMAFVQEPIWHMRMTYASLAAFG